MMPHGLLNNREAVKMKYDEMKAGLIYKATKPSSDGSIAIGGEVTRISDKDIGFCNAKVSKIIHYDNPYHKTESFDFEAELYDDPDTAESLKAALSHEPLDIDYCIIKCRQRALRMPAVPEANEFFRLEAKDCYQISEWLKELKTLRELVSNTMKRF